MLEAFRTRRRILGCVMLALALLIAAAAVRSHQWGHRLHVRIQRYGIGLESQSGLVSCAVYWPKEGVEFVDTWLDWDSLELKPDKKDPGAILGPPFAFGFTRSVDGRQTINFGLGPWTLNYAVIYMPYWSVILLFAVCSTWLFVRTPRKPKPA